MPFTQKKADLIAELREAGIADEGVLQAIGTVPRELFVPESFISKSYDNVALPMIRGQSISQPYTVALMTAELKVGPRMNVLEIGTGSGYQGAVLACLARRVFTMERYRSLMTSARSRFEYLRLHNITTKLGDGHKGWPEQAPFQRIMVTAAASRIPPLLVDQLADGGIMILPLGEHEGDQHIYRVTRHGSHFDEQEIMPTRFVPLVAGLAYEP
jgi:protein-L-isoaspartate(D-aspartate) O-methyltransferase